MSHDSQLQEAVLAELKWEPSITAAHIGVAANDGVVTLTGHVESFVERHAAESAARRVKGVKGVAEEIEVRLPFELKRGDEEIAAAAVERLAWDTSVPKDAVQVKVEKGWVTLTGELDWHFQQEAAEWAVRRLEGVVGVFNQTTIKPQVNVGDISKNITQALHRSWFFDPATVKVSADSHGKVKLTGTVNSWSDWQAASTTAWAAPGTTAVENNLSIN